MKKKQNSGMSMVEVIISVAIFSVLMVPIVSGITAALKNSTRSKELQYRNELAEHLLEYVKEDSLENVLSMSYFDYIGAYDVKQDTPVTGVYPSKNLKTLADTEAEYATYTLSGSMNLGTKHTKYSYKIQISNEEYAKKEADSATALFDDFTMNPAKYDDVDLSALQYQNPNNVKLGVVEDLDYTKLALINGTIANYDAVVTDAFITRKLELLKKYSPAQFEQYVNQAYEFNPFSRDKVKRQIIIGVSGDKTKGYTVKCTLRYTDDSAYSLMNGTSMKDLLVSEKKNVIEYVPYSTSFEELPNIYLMYNVCLYNGFYADSDYIVLDTSRLALEEDVTLETGSTIKSTTEVNLFIVETAATYTDGIANTLATMDAKKEDENPADETILKLKEKYLTKILYDTRDTATGQDRENVQINLVATKNTSGTAHLANVHIYHNFDVTATGGKQSNTNTKLNYTTKPTDLYTAQVDEDGNVVYTKDANGESITIPEACGVMVTRNTLTNKVNREKSPTIEAIGDALKESRGLYNIKIWISEGEIADVDTSSSPLITGTKGGSAID